MVVECEWQPIFLETSASSKRVWLAKPVERSKETLRASFQELIAYRYVSIRFWLEGEKYIIQLHPSFVTVEICE